MLTGTGRRGQDSGSWEGSGAQESLAHWKSETVAIAQWGTERRNEARVAGAGPVIHMFLFLSLILNSAKRAWHKSASGFQSLLELWNEEGCRKAQAGGATVWPGRGQPAWKLTGRRSDLQVCRPQVSGAGLASKGQFPGFCLNYQEVKRGPLGWGWRVRGRRRNQTRNWVQRKIFIY